MAITLQANQSPMAESDYPSTIPLAELRKMRLPPIFDHEASLARVDGDRELLREMAGLFLDSYPASLRLIEEGVANGNTEQVYRAAHTLKGSAANFNAVSVVDAAYQLESMGREGRLENAVAALTAMQSDLRRLANALEKLAGRE